MSIGSASSHILCRDAEGVFDTVAQALVPAAPGLFPALGLWQIPVNENQLVEKPGFGLTGLKNR
jgi:hypothetical protein